GDLLWNIVFIDGKTISGKVFDRISLLIRDNHVHNHQILIDTQRVNAALFSRRIQHLRPDSESPQRKDKNRQADSFTFGHTHENSPEPRGASAAVVGGSLCPRATHT